jgi:Flp pilus assembly protein, protease CpaA
MNEFQALGELLWMLVTDPNTGVLIALLVVAAVIDWRSARLPNWLTLSGAAYALVYQAGHGIGSGSGLTTAALGLLTGLVLLLPLYAIRVVGAGDAKLLAMVGTFLGAAAVLKAALFIFVIGGAGALIFTYSRRATGLLAANVRDIALSVVTPGMPVWRPGGAAVSVGRMSYGVCISLGTVVFLIARQLAFI